MVQYLKDFFTYEGRIGRKQYLKALGVIFLTSMLIVFVTFGVVYLLFDLSYLDFILKIRPVMAIIGLVLFFCPAVKRLHDMGWSSWIFSIYVLAQICGLMVAIDADGKRFIFEALDAFEREWLFFTMGLNFIVFIISFILLFKKGIAGSNKYGPDPLAVS